MSDELWSAWDVAQHVGLPSTWAARGWLRKHGIRAAGRRGNAAAFSAAEVVRCRAYELRRAVLGAG